MVGGGGAGEEEDDSARSWISLDFFRRQCEMVSQSAQPPILQRHRIGSAGLPHITSAKEAHGWGNAEEDSPKALGMLLGCHTTLFSSS